MPGGFAFMHLFDTNAIKTGNFQVEKILFFGKKQIVFGLN